MANGDDNVLLAEPLFIGVARGDDKLFKGIVGKCENIPEKHDPGRVSLPEFQGLLGAEDLIHNVSNFKA